MDTLVPQVSICLTGLKTVEATPAVCDKVCAESCGKEVYSAHCWCVRANSAIGRHGRTQAPVSRRA